MSNLPTRLFSLTCKIHKTLAVYSLQCYLKNVQVYLITTKHHYCLICTRQAFPIILIGNEDLIVCEFVCMYVCQTGDLHPIRRG